MGSDASIEEDGDCDQGARPHESEDGEAECAILQYHGTEMMIGVPAGVVVCGDFDLVVDA